jgi:HEAT repeat protein
MDRFVALAGDDNVPGSIRQGAIVGLGILKDKRGAQGLQAIVGDKASPPELRRDAMMALSHVDGENNLPLFLEILDDSTEQIGLRKWVVRTLAGLRSDSAVDALAGALLLDNFSVQQAAVDALVKIADGRVVERVGALLVDSRIRSKVRSTAAWILGRIGDPKAGPYLLRALETGNSVVRTQVVEAIGRVHDPAAVPRLIELVNSADGIGKGFLTAAVTTLGELRDRRASEPLIRLLENTPEDVQSSVLIALGKLGDRRAAPHIEPFMTSEHWANDIRVAAAEALGELKDETAVEALCDVVHDVDESDELRRRAVQSLGRIGGVRAREELLATAQNGAAGMPIRKEAIRAAGSIGGEEVAEGLIGVLRSKGIAVRQTAIEELQRLRSLAAVEPLYSMVRDPRCDIGLRRLAVRSLEILRPPDLAQCFVNVLEEGAPTFLIMPAIARIAGSADATMLAGAVLSAWIRDAVNDDRLVEHYEALYAIAPYLRLQVAEGERLAWRRRLMPPSRRVLLGVSRRFPGAWPTSKELFASLGKSGGF